MDTKDKNQELTSLTSPGVMPPDSVMSPSVMSPVQLEIDLAELADSKEIPPELIETIKKKPTTPFQDSMRRLRRDVRAMLSVGMIGFFVVLAIIGPFIYQHVGGPYTSSISGTGIGPQVYHTFYHQELDRQDEGPSAQYWLGTDTLGRDLFARLMQGILISISVAVLVEVVDISLGILVGVLAGYYGGWIDQVLARFTDIIFAFPGLLFIILIAGIFGEWADTNLSPIPVIGPNGNARLLLVSLAIATTVWPLMARYVRGQTLQLKEQQFIEAARTAGTSNTRIIMRHIIPNLFSIVVVASTLNIVGTIISEAGIRLLGLGVPAPGSRIGVMISDAQSQVSAHPWEILLPSAVLALIVLSFSFIGDGLRDAFDPRSKD